MLHRLLGAESTAATLKQGLDASSARAKGIASRIANIGNGSFADAMAQVNGTSQEMQLEQEMVQLADEQIRFDAAARLLQRVYAQVRTSIRER